MNRSELCGKSESNGESFCVTRMCNPMPKFVRVQDVSGMILSFASHSPAP